MTILTEKIRRVRRGGAVCFLPARSRPTGRPLHVARRIALAHFCEELIDAGVVSDQTELALVLGFTKAKISQLMDLTLLAPDIQEQVLTAMVQQGRDWVSERSLRAIAASSDWSEQRARWRQLGLRELRNKHVA